MFEHSGSNIYCVSNLNLQAMLSLRLDIDRLQTILGLLHKRGLRSHKLPMGQVVNINNPLGTIQPPQPEMTGVNNERPGGRCQLDLCQHSTFKLDG